MFQLLVILGLLLVVEKLWGESLLTFVFECGVAIYFWAVQARTPLDYVTFAVASAFWARVWFRRYSAWDKKRKTVISQQVP